MQQVISFHYRLTNKEGNLVDQSEKDRPLIFLSGSGQIIPGLEALLISLTSGDKRTITVPAVEAYGEYHPHLVYEVNKSKLPTNEVKVGDVFEAGQGEQMMIVEVKSVSGDTVTLDGNHPLAGQDLTFDVEVVERRDATPIEVAHGHVHGAGDCAH